MAFPSPHFGVLTFQFSDGFISWSNVASIWWEMFSIVFWIKNDPSPIWKQSQNWSDFLTFIAPYCTFGKEHLGVYGKTWLDVFYIVPNAGSESYPNGVEIAEWFWWRGCSERCINSVQAWNELRPLPREWEYNGFNCHFQSHTLRMPKISTEKRSETKHILSISQHLLPPSGAL